MRKVAVTQKISMQNDELKNKLIHQYLLSTQFIKRLNIRDLKTKSEIEYNKDTDYKGDDYGYSYRLSEYTDRVNLRPGFDKKSFIWIFLSDENLKYREEIARKMFEITTPISMEYGQDLNDRNVRTPSYVYLDKELGEFATEKWLGFNIEWTFIVDFKVDIKSKIPKEILLRATAYKVEELDNGCVYVQLTEEEPMATEFDEEYVAGFLEFYEYCKKYLEENK